MAISNEEINQNLKKVSSWKRILFMLIFAVIVGIVRILLWAAVLLQVAFVLFTGSPNDNVLKFGKLLAAYLYQILLFLTYNTEDMPFPFAELGVVAEEHVSETVRKRP